MLIHINLVSVQKAPFDYCFLTTGIQMNTLIGNNTRHVFTISPRHKVNCVLDVASTLFLAIFSFNINSLSINSSGSFLGYWLVVH